MLKVLCLGEALLDLIAFEPGKRIEEAKNFYLAPGGAVCNVAVGLARLGIKVGLITKIGTDPFGKFMLKFLKKEKVDTRLVKITDQHLTGLVLVRLDKKKNPGFFFYGAPGADRMLSPAEIREKNFSGIKVFHFGTVSLSMEPVRSATVKALKLAKKAKARISFDPNFRFHLWKNPVQLKKITLSLAPELDLVKLNQEELKFLTGEKNLEKGAKMLLKMGTKIVLVTLGRKGAFFATEKHQEYVPGYKFKPVDTTGAGDAFSSAIIAWLLRFPKIPPEKDEIVKALRFANAFAGLSTLRLGAIEGLLSWKRVEKFVKKNS